jgi:hypothetical protein
LNPPHGFDRAGDELVVVVEDAVKIEEDAAEAVVHMELILGMHCLAASISSRLLTRSTVGCTFHPAGIPSLTTWQR